MPNFATLVLMRGIPGSGKSHLASLLIDEIGRDNVLTLDPDEIDRASQTYKEHVDSMTAEGVEDKFHPHRFLRSQAFDAIAAHKVILWNQPFNDRGGFQRTIAALVDYAAEQQTELRILVVEVEVDSQVAHQRVAERKSRGGHGPSPDTFARFAAQYQSFADEGFKTVTVRGEKDPAESLAIIMKGLHELWG